MTDTTQLTSAGDSSLKVSAHSQGYDGTGMESSPQHLANLDVKPAQLFVATDPLLNKSSSCISFLLRSTGPNLSCEMPGASPGSSQF